MHGMKILSSQKSMWTPQTTKVTDRIDSCYRNQTRLCLALRVSTYFLTPNLNRLWVFMEVEPHLRSPCRRPWGPPRCRWWTWRSWGSWWTSCCWSRTCRCRPCALPPNTFRWTLGRPYRSAFRPDPWSVTRDGQRISWRGIKWIKPTILDSRHNKKQQQQHETDYKHIANYTRNTGYHFLSWKL